MSEVPGSQRREVHYQGRVQGVGFRYTARRIAAGFRVTGYVRNLPNGGVELVAEGDAAELQRFLNAVRREMDHCIDHIEQSTGPATGEFRRFEIRH